MSLSDAFILGTLQGLAEFLPISSSGHLIFAEYFLELPVENLKGFDIAVHFGTLLAILIYFGKDIWRLIVAFLMQIGGIFNKKMAFSEEVKRDQKFAWTLILATIPAIIFALTLGDWLDEKFRNPYTVAILMIAVGGLFLVAEYLHKKMREGKIQMKEGVLMGLAQCLALIPGVSRSGITISAGLVQGVKREEAARFSFLLGAIAILGATVFAVNAIAKGKYGLPETDILVAGIFSSFVVGLASISFLMRYLKNHTLTIFAVYRFLLGFGVLILLMMKS